MQARRGIAALCAAAALAAPAPAAAAEEEIGARLSIELNTARSVEGGCELSFLAINGHARDVEAAVFEAVLFDAEGRVERLTLLDFGALPAGRPRVRQFVLPETTCEGLGEVLFNGATDCAAGDLGPAACTDGLELRSRADIGVIG
ncbi:hypothetical protein [Rhodosalinus sediminis]|jgi:hypothetical protein|uniref:hypothetical protein n=1 Tax=Rhodosalinus sediminis TaxID=1940533 RepID=UPI002356E05D|nr:hypothetical protein [Rhodosalinus sediminis]